MASSGRLWADDDDDDYTRPSTCIVILNPHVLALQFNSVTDIKYCKERSRRKLVLSQHKYNKNVYSILLNLLYPSSAI